MKKISCALFLMLLLFCGCSTKSAYSTSLIDARIATVSAESNTFERMDALYALGKEDSKTVDEEYLTEASHFVVENLENLYKDNQTMERAIYCGGLMEHRFRGVNDDLENIGYNLYKAVKYVYCGTETAEDDAPQFNVNKIKELIGSMAQP